MKSNNTTTRMIMKRYDIRQTIIRLVLLLLLPVAFMQIVAGSSKTYYGKLQTSATGSGKAYVAKGQNATVGTATSATNNVSGYRASAVYFSLKAVPDKGYYFTGWSASSTNLTISSTSSLTTNANFTPSSTTSSNPTTYTATAAFSEITISAGTASPSHIDATDNTTTCTDYTGTITFTTKADAKDDFKDATPPFVNTGHGAFSITDWSVASDGKVTVNYKFVGDGTYGGVSGTRSRSTTGVLTLTSYAGNNKGTCTVTASFPNIIVSEGTTEALTTISTTPKQSTATFPVQWADDVNDFTASFGNINGGGAWTVDNIAYTATDSQSGTVTVTYTFNPQNVEGDHSARLTLSANSNAGGASNYVDISAVSEKLAEDDAQVTYNGTTTAYGYLKDAIAAANGKTGAVVQLLRNIPVDDAHKLTAPLNVTGTMTLDLNSYTIAETGLVDGNQQIITVNMSNAANVLTITDSRTGGTIQATGNNNNNMLYAICMEKGVLNIVGGNINCENTNTGASAKATSVRVKSGCKLLMTGGTLNAITAGSPARGIYSTTAPDSKNMVVISGGTINTSAKNISVGIDCESTTTTLTSDPTDANVILSGVTVNASTTTTTEAYALRTAAGVCMLINSGNYNATTKTTTAYALLSKGYTAVVNGTFKAEATTTTARAISVEAGITAVRNGIFTATAATEKAHTAYAGSGAKLLVYGGTFHGTLTNAGSGQYTSGAYIAEGGTLEAEGGTFIGEVQKTGLTAAQTNYASGVHAAAGSIATISNATLEGKTSNTYLNGARALYSLTANPVTITNCTLTASSQNQYAYAIYASATPLTARGCTATVTAQTGYSYGIYVDGATGNVETYNCTFNSTSNTTYAYGAYVMNGALSSTDTKYIVETKQATATAATAAADSYLRGIFVKPSKSIYLNGCTITATGNATYSNSAYGLYIDGSAEIENTTVTVSSINKTAYAIYNSSNTTAINIASGKFMATATTTGLSTNAAAAATKQKLYGGYYNTNNNLSKYLPDGYGIEELPTTSTEYKEGYRYTIHPTTDVGTIVCKIGAVGYTTLEEALEVVNKSGATSTILMVADYTLPAGNYTLPTNATLLVPRSGQTTAQGTTAKLASSSNTNGQKINLTLTFASGVNFVNYGTIETGGEENPGGGGKVAGNTCNPFGLLKLNSGAHLDLEGSSKLQCWGYVIGDGTITAKSGAATYENFEMACCKGGTIMSNYFYSVFSGWQTNVFPIDDYFIQNIESEITYLPGAHAYASSSMYIAGTYAANGINIVGTTADTYCLFKMTTDGTRPNMYVKRRYTPSTDRCTWTLNDGAMLSNIQVQLGSYDIQSKNFVLPISSSMDIVMNYGTLSVMSGQDLFLMPGSRIVIKKDAILKIPSGVNFYVYDVAEWNLCKPIANYVFTAYYSPDRPSPNPRKGILTDKTNLPSAEIFVQGTLQIEGSLQTTASGANIHSTNEDAGQVVFLSNATKTGSVTQYTSSGSGVTSSTTSAKLRNGDGTYVTTADAVKNDVYIYQDDVWVKVSTSDCFMTRTINEVVHQYAHPKDWVEVSANDPDDHAYHVTADPTRYVIQGKDCNWIEVQPDGTDYKCVNENSVYYNSYFEYDEKGYWVEKTVTIKFDDTQGNVTTYSNVPYKSIPIFEGATPQKDAGEKEYYIFTGWTKGSTTGEFYATDATLPEATESVTYYAYFETHKYQYTITFKNYDGTVLQASRWQIDETPTYDHDDPQKPSTAQYYYRFKGWSPAITTVSAQATYTAQYDERTRKYAITWVNYDGTILKEDSVEYNTTPTAPSTPSHANDNFYSYTFSGWSPTVNKVTGNQVYTAQYTYEQRKTKYTITFKNGSETAYTQYLTDGETPAFNGNTPTKDATAQYTYTFAGWSATEGGAVLASLPAVSGAAVTYYAVYTSTVNTYKIVWKTEDGKQVLETDEDIAYGSTPSYDSATPTKARQGSTIYTFDGWSVTKEGEKIALPPVAGNTTYYAHFSDKPVFTVTFDANGHGEAPATQEVVSGEKVIEPSEPTVEGWIFGGWYKEVACENAWDFATDAITAETTIYAKWTAVVASVTISGSTTYYATLGEAFTYAKGKTTPLVTILRDIELTAILTISHSTTTTLDLNGYTISGAVSNYLFYINASSANTKLIIRDSSASETGTISNTVSANGARYCVYLYKGALALESGTIYIENTNTGTSTGAYGVYVASSRQFTMTGGKIESHSTKSAYGIFSYGTTTINGGEIETYETSQGSSYGVYAANGTTTIKQNGTTALKITSNGTTNVAAMMAGGATPNSSKGTLYQGTLNVISGQFSATATGASGVAYGVYVTANTRAIAYSTSSTYAGNYACAGTANISGGEFTINGVTAYGIGLKKPVSIATAKDADGNTTYEPATASPTATIIGGKFNIIGTKTQGAVNTTATVDNLLVQGGYYNIDTNLGAKYTAPAKDVNYYTLKLAETDENYNPYYYNVAEAYKVVFKDGDDKELTNTGNPNGNIFEKNTTPTYSGATPTKAETEAYSYAFNGKWSDGDNVYDAASLPVVTAAATYTAQFDATAKVLGDRFDIVDWETMAGKVTAAVLNMNGYSSETAGTGWKVRVAGADYTKANRDSSTENPAGDRTMRVDLSSLNLTADQTFVMQGLGTDDKVESYQTYIAPHVYESNTTLSGVTESSIVWVREGTLTVSSSATVAAVYVAPRAGLKVQAGATLTTDKLVLRTDSVSAANLTNNGTINCANVYYTRIMRGKKYANGFALPYDSRIADVEFSTGVAAKYGSTWGLMTYDGATRAASGINETSSNWKSVASTEIKAHTGYQITSTSKFYCEFYFPVTLTAIAANSQLSVATYNAEADKADIGWNYLSSPYTSAFTCTSSSPDEAVKISVYDEVYKKYYQVPAYDLTLTPAMPFFYQAAADGKLVFDASEFRFVATSGASAPRRVPKQYTSTIPTQWLTLQLTNAQEQTDETHIYLHPDKFTEEYEVGYDVLKMSKTGATPLLYSSLPCGDLAFAALPDEVATIPLTVFAPTMGEMTIALRENDFMERLEQVWLVDTETDETTDLLQQEYVYFAKQGTTAGRFYLRTMMRAPQQTEVVTDDLLVSDGFIVYVKERSIVVTDISGVRQVRLYNAVGQLMSTDEIIGEKIYDVATAGVYFVQVGSEIRKVVVK